MRKNELLELEITGLTAEGSGVGRMNGMAVFVPQAAPGDRIIARILKVTKSLAYGKIERVLFSSEERIEPDCPVFSQCGGCAFRHITYEAERRAKWQKVADALRRIGKLEIDPAPLLSAEITEAYRNKAQYPIGMKDGRIQIGFYAPRSHRIVDCRTCCLQPPEFAGALRAVEMYITSENVSVYDEKAHKGLLRHIYIRMGFSTGEIMVCLVANGESLPRPERLTGLLRQAVPGLASVILNVNTNDTNVILGKRCVTLWGSDTIRDKLCGLTFTLSPLSFFQVNPAATELLYEKAREYAEPQGKELLDLYCGAGTIGLSMAHAAKRVTGIEVIPEAVENAKKNARDNQIGNARFFCGAAEKTAVSLAKEGYRPDVVILDPPRKGCEESLIRTVAEQFQPERVVYVSCAPATLARDLARFEQLGYRARAVTPVDLFPRTKHVESVAMIQKNGKAGGSI